MRKLFLAAAMSVLLPAAANAASAVIKSADGQEMGTLNLVQTAKGVHITGELRGIEPGIHAFHIHETGKCEPPFKSAGGHFNPKKVAHGKGEGGPHAGDMENLAVVDSGPVRIDVYNARVTLNTHGKNSLFDADGSAFIIHAKADDYVSQPTGDAGGRVACGVIE